MSNCVPLRKVNKSQATESNEYKFLEIAISISFRLVCWLLTGLSVMIGLMIHE